DGVHAHESPRWMTGPLYVLAVGAVFAGYVGFPGHAFQHYLGEPTKAFAKHATEPHGWDLSVTTMMTVSGVIFFVGLAVAFYRYVLSREQSRASEEAGLARPGVFCLLNGKYFVDEGYDLVVVQPLRWLGRALFTVDRIVIDGVVWLVAAVPQGLGFGLRGLQRGSMQGYGLGMALGAVGVLLLVLYGAVK
ncbi:MAG TPA: hypothetical protein VGA66_05335, partial [Mycobacterium sp.]